MGRNLPLIVRRENAIGLSPRTQRAWRGRKFLSLASGRRAFAASVGTGNAAIRLRAIQPGTGGNSITFTIAIGGAAPVVTYAGNAVTLTTPATTTAIQAVDAINRSTTTDAAGRLTKLIGAQLATGSDGTGTVAAAGPVTLSGGTAAG